MSPLYTAAITIYFLLSIRYRYKEFELARLEKWVHPVIWFVGISTATAGIPLKLYNPKVQWCWIASLPRGCVGDGCVRGHNAKYFLVSFAFAWIWMGVLVTTTSLAMLYFTVQRSEMRSSVYQISTVQRRISQVDQMQYQEPLLELEDKLSLHQLFLKQMSCLRRLKYQSLNLLCRKY